MKRALSWLGLAALAVLTLLIGAFAFAWWSSERVLSLRIDVADPPLARVGDDGRAHGRHLFHSRGCSDCHGERGEGRVVFDVPPARVVASNLTAAGEGRHYDRDAFGRAVRHGVAHDGRALRFMPIEDYAELSDADAAALAAYLESLPAVDNDPGTTQVRPLGRLLHAFGQLELVPARHVDHRPRERAAPAPAATAEFGAYVARTCRGCHGGGYRGGRVPGTPPEMPPASDLTALHDWQAEDFRRLMREGLRPDRTPVHPLMPWQAFRTMTDVELSAMWLFFRELAATGP